MDRTAERPPAASRGPAGRHDFGIAADDARTEAEFARADRHTRRVRVLKIGLPILAVAMILAGVVATWFARSIPEGVSVADASIEDGQVVMQDPRMSGIDSKGRPYELIARRAVQSVMGDEGIELDGVDATIAISDDATARIQASGGYYLPDEEVLRLDGGIGVETSDGISVDLSKARIDVRSGALSGSGPVRITTPRQTIESGSIEVTEGGRRVSFGGRVKLQLKPLDEPEPERQALRSP